MGPGAEEEEEKPFGKTTVAADISEDEGSDVSEEMPDFGKMDHLLTAAVHKVALRWLSFVRAEEKELYEISSDSDSDASEDVNFAIPLITQSTKEISEVWMRKVALYL